MVTKVRVVQYGCGPVGCAVVRYVAQRPDLELVGAIDIDERLVGKDLGEVAGIEKLGVIISADAAAVHVGDVASRTRGDEQRIGANIAEGTHRRVDSAGNPFLSGVKELFASTHDLRRPP